MANGNMGGISGVAIRRPVFTTMMMIGLVVLGLFATAGCRSTSSRTSTSRSSSCRRSIPARARRRSSARSRSALEEAFNPVAGRRPDHLDLARGRVAGRRRVRPGARRRRRLAGHPRQDRRRSAAISRPTSSSRSCRSSTRPRSRSCRWRWRRRRSPIAALTALADETIRRAAGERCAALARCSIAGGLEREVRVYLQPDRLQALGVTVPEVMAALRAQNLEVPAGRVERGAQRAAGARHRAHHATRRSSREVIVANRDGAPVRLGDVARVEDGTEEERSIALVDGAARRVARHPQGLGRQHRGGGRRRASRRSSELRRALPRGTTLRWCATTRCIDPPARSRT